MTAAVACCPHCAVESSEDYLRTGLCWPCYLAVEAAAVKVAGSDERKIRTLLEAVPHAR